MATKDKAAKEKEPEMEEETGMKIPDGRFYENRFPELDELVLVQVVRIAENAAYVAVLEYDRAEGMILLSELSKRRIRSISKEARVGGIEVCMVLRVDEEKGYIDLSKRRVPPEDIAPKKEVFAKARAVHGVMRHVAAQNDVSLEDLSAVVSWPLYAKYGAGHGAYDQFRLHVNGEKNIFNELSFKIKDEEEEIDIDLEAKKEKIIADIDVSLKRRLMQQQLRLRAKIEVSCFEYEGIDAVVESLLEGQKASRPECELKTKLIAHPLFQIVTMCRDKQLGIETIEKATELIKTSIEAKGGVFEMKSKPEVLGGDEPDDKEEDSGDDDGKSSSSESDEDETMGKIEGLDAMADAAAKDAKAEDSD